MAKWFLPTLFGTWAVIYIIFGFSAHPKKAIYYNAYAPGYDEYFVIKSYTWLPIDTVVNFNDNAVVTEYKTGYQARILSPYIGKVGHY